MRILGIITFLIFFAVGKIAYELHSTQWVRVSLHNFSAIEFPQLSIASNWSFEHKVHDYVIAKVEKQITLDVVTEPKKHQIKEKVIVGKKPFPAARNLVATSSKIFVENFQTINLATKIKDNKFLAFQLNKSVSAFDIDTSALLIHSWKTFAQKVSFQNGKILGVEKLLATLGEQEILRKDIPLLAANILIEDLNQHVEVINLAQAAPQRVSEVNKEIVKDKIPQSEDNLVFVDIPEKPQSVSNHSPSEYPDENMEKAEVQQEHTFWNLMDDRTDEKRPETVQNIPVQQASAKVKDDVHQPLVSSSSYTPPEFLRSDYPLPDSVSRAVKREMGTQVKERAGRAASVVNTQFKQGAHGDSQALSIQKEELVLYAKIVDLSGGYSSDFEGFDFIDELEYRKFSDQMSGSISFDYDNEKGNSIIGTILSSDAFPVRLNLSPKGKAEQMIPLISKDSFENGEMIGGIVVVERDKKLSSLDIDTVYNGDKLYLNSVLKPVLSFSEAQFVVFLGVNPGTTDLSYAFQNYVYYRPILVQEGVVTFVSNELSSRDSSIVELKERWPLQQSLKSPSFLQSDVFMFNSKKSIKLLNSSHFKVAPSVAIDDYPRVISYKRSAYDLFSFDYNLDQVVLPSEDWINYILDSVSLNETSLSNLCLYEINLPNNDGPTNIVVSMRNNRSENMAWDQLFVDDDGKIYDDYSIDTKHFYLLGQEPGVYTFRVKLLSGKEITLERFCTRPNSIITEKIFEE